jgi:hypothetical protein
MPRVDISQLPDESRIWIFGVSPALNNDQSQRLLAAIDGFLDRWSAHNQPIVSARDFLYDSFLVIAVDQRSETSGCSIDRMFGLLQQLEGELGVSILEPNRIFCRTPDGAVQTMSRAYFRKNGTAQTLVFDTVAERLAAIRNGAWQKQAGQLWQGALFS